MSRVLHAPCRAHRIPRGRLLIHRQPCAWYPSFSWVRPDRNHRKRNQLQDVADGRCLDPRVTSRSSFVDGDSHMGALHSTVYTYTSPDVVFSVSDIPTFPRRKNPGPNACFSSTTAPIQIRTRSLVLLLHPCRCCRPKSFCTV